MLVYVYDGCFEGLLTAVYEAYSRRERPDHILSAQGLAMNLFDQYQEIFTDPVKCNKIVEAIRLKISEEALERVTQVYLADISDPGTLVYQYLRLGFQLGSAVDNHLHEDCVLSVHKISRKVGFEVHRFEGLLRFVRTGWGIYYAKLEPDHNIVSQLAPHFASRLSDQDWIIHDTRRGIAAMYNQREWIITDQVPAQLVSPSSDGAGDSEEFFQALWREYFQNIAIAERKNIKLQKNHMPSRYWKNLTEIKPG